MQTSSAARYLFLLLTLNIIPATLIPFSARCEEPKTLTVLWWNVENLFDTIDDPQTDDDEFTPQGKKQWTSRKLAVKYLRLSHVIKLASINLNNGSYPDIIALAEVENRHVVKTLLSFLPGHEYEVVHHDSEDPRGIDISLAYNRSSVSVISSRAFRVELEQLRTRDILLYELSLGPHPLYLLLNHWPSRSFSKAWSEPSRTEAARTLRSVIDSLRTIDPYHDIIVAGDFNDEPHNKSISEVLGSVTEKQPVLRACKSKLYNLWAETDAPGSYYYRNTWNRLDQILVSCGLLDSSGIMLQRNPFTCFSPEHIRNPANGSPLPAWKGGRYLGGYSDHFPLILRIATE